MCLTFSPLIYSSLNLKYTLKLNSYHQCETAVNLRFVPPHLRGLSSGKVWMVASCNMKLQSFQLYPLVIHSSCWLSPWFLLKEEHAKTEGHVNVCLLSNTDCHNFPVSWNPSKLHPVLTLIPKLAICAPNWTYEMQLSSSLLLLDVINIHILHKVAVTSQGWPKMLSWDKFPLEKPSVQPSSFSPCWT